MTNPIRESQSLIRSKIESEYLHFFSISLYEVLFARRRQSLTYGGMRE